MNKKTSKTIIKASLLLVFVVLVVVIVLNRVWIYDFFRGVTYRPSLEMEEIRQKLGLTGRGEFLFNASQPTLNSEDDFNMYCASAGDAAAVLGCYSQQNVYVYNITEPSLEGIRELTTAHELLHAVYGRLSDIEKEKLRPSLEKVYQENPDILKSEIENYSTEHRMEEIYVRAGTEIKDLPEILEKHYAEIFTDQDKIVNFYNNYIGTFRMIEKKLDELKVELDAVQMEINNKSAEYERQVSELQADIYSFNNCANTAGCFASEYSFRMQRADLLGRQASLQELYAEIDNLIGEYNLLVEEYNDNILESKHLNNIINSHVKVEGM